MNMRQNKTICSVANFVLAKFGLLTFAFFQAYWYQKKKNQNLNHFETQKLAILK